MKLKVLAIAIPLLFTAFLMPTATAESMGTTCVPPGGPVGGCVDYGFEQESVYYTDVDVTTWEMYCVWLACVMRPYPALSSEYLMDAPVPYVAGSLNYPCGKFSTCTLSWDTRGILDAIAVDTPVVLA